MTLEPSNDDDRRVSPVVTQSPHPRPRCPAYTNLQSQPLSTRHLPLLSCHVNTGHPQTHGTTPIPYRSSQPLAYSLHPRSLPSSTERPVPSLVRRCAQNRERRHVTSGHYPTSG